MSSHEQGRQGGSTPENQRQAERAVNNLFREMGLFGDHTPKGADPTFFPLDIMGDVQSLITRKAYLQGYEKDLAERWAPYQETLRRVEAAYEIIAYPRLEQTGYGLEMRDKIRDAIEHPERDAVELRDEELKILNELAKGRKLPFHPEKRVYRYSEHALRRDAYNQDIMRRFGQIAEDNAFDAGMTRERSEIEKEIFARQAKWQHPSSGQHPQEPKPKK